jgi:hypothetical protein
MGRSKNNLGRRVPARIDNPPNKSANPEWWKDGKNLMRLHPSYEDRRKYEKQQKKRLG